MQGNKETLPGPALRYVARSDPQALLAHLRSSVCGQFGDVAAGGLVRLSAFARAGHSFLNETGSGKPD